MKKKLFQYLKTFVVTILVAFIATNQENYIYKILDIIGYESDLLKKTVLSAIIALFIGLLSLCITYLWSKIKLIFQKLDVSFNTKLNGTKRTTMKFSPNDYEYASQDVEFEVNFNPGGWVSNFLIKKLGISLNIYFNPELLDIYFIDKWEIDKHEVFNISERKITINLLGNMEIKGREFKGRYHKLNEQFRVKPIRVKNAETALDLVIVSDNFDKFTRLIAKHFITVDFEALKVTCKGE
ncbi:hypothetical protein [Salimicrobium halophilum]|uniref:Uncharacterized protein n=1 Tax=Salimicrobium halophilum TaxID=86666 RepID=A0A1G8WHX1_9BACI|nr:hypothetical protein [Salimicrobium halophilum]SDJ77801.1 hypothetical protein SAMN04490247_3191 [Salimicrobium halophilum]